MGVSAPHSPAEPTRPPSPKGRSREGRQRPSPVPGTAALRFACQPPLHQGLFWPTHVAGGSSAKAEKNAYVTIPVTQMGVPELLLAGDATAGPAAGAPVRAAAGKGRSSEAMLATTGRAGGSQVGAVAPARGRARYPQHPPRLRHLLAGLSALPFLPRDAARCGECFPADCSFCSEQRALGKAGNLESPTKRNRECLLKAKAVKHAQFPKHPVSSPVFC